jgi:hypothetical protein
VPHEVPPGFSFGFVDQPVTIHGYQAVGIDYSNAEPLSILVKEYAPGLSPSIADPQTGVVRVDGDTWKLYGKTPALVRTFADGVTIEVDGAEGAPRRDLLILARGLR